ncbi:aminotransferase class V-fold PLP-dependent enzyme [Paraflavitalea speifideaquila]|uniref:aminotransferase class V-fold PLP-dependent enzyme n=1 Tax=Paraflavitalea speifideaquila TaxID=3076558 RepID=UPI0028E6775B|nr:aminotransferase class V-fold PLP-dependent enzyme [Paraflavitalea speifideiaquila]
MHINNAPIGGVDLDDLRTKLHQYQPKLLAITHIPTNSGLVQPVEEIAGIYQAYINRYPGKTWYILDACQSAGQMKLDVQKLHCDFLSITCRKFLRGHGVRVPFISPIKPCKRDWNRCSLTCGEPPGQKKDAYEQQPGAKRFEDWEFAYATVVGTTAAIEYCRAIGEEKIWQQVQLMAKTTREKLARLNGVRVLDRGPQQGGLVTFTVAGGDPVKLSMNYCNVQSM